MEKEFIPYELALALKELGFDENCMGYYHGGNPLKFTLTDKIRNKNTLARVKRDNKNGHTVYLCTAPLYQQAFRWFREKYGIYSFVDVINYQGLYDYEIKRKNHETIRETLNKTYEEAELACLKKLIEIALEAGVQDSLKSIQ